MLLLLLALLYLPLRARVRYRDKALAVTAYVAGIPIHIVGGRKRKNKKKREDKKAPDKEKNEEEKKAKKDKDEVLSALDKFFCALNAFYDASARIRHAVRIETLDLKVRLSSGDAAATGFLVGMAYAEFYKLVAFFACLFTLEKPKAEFQPVFSDELLFEANFDGIIRTDLAHSISAGAAFYFSYRKQINKIKERVEQNGTSNSGVN